MRRFSYSIQNTHQEIEQQYDKDPNNPNLRPITLSTHVKPQSIISSYQNHRDKKICGHPHQ